MTDSLSAAVLWENYLAVATSDDDDLYSIEGMTEAAHDIYLALIAAFAREAAQVETIAKLKAIVDQFSFYLKEMGGLDDDRDTTGTCCAADGVYAGAFWK